MGNNTVTDGQGNLDYVLKIGLGHIGEYYICFEFGSTFSMYVIFMTTFLAEGITGTSPTYGGSSPYNIGMFISTGGEAIATLSCTIGGCPGILQGYPVGVYVYPVGKQAVVTSGDLSGSNYKLTNTMDDYKNWINFKSLRVVQADWQGKATYSYLTVSDLDTNNLDVNF